MSYPPSIRLLIEQFAKFPGIGEKAAQRFVFFLLRQPSSELIKTAKLIMSLHDSVTLCLTCHNYSERNPCALCASASRDRSVICVVAQSHDVSALEKTREYKGLYHVLGGTINILEGITPDKLKVRDLVERVRDSSKKITEVILAFNPDLEGESTNLYLSKILKPYAIRVTRLARGLPRGADIDYADEVTLGDALKSRRAL